MNSISPLLVPLHPRPPSLHTLIIQTFRVPVKITEHAYGVPGAASTSQVFDES